MFVYIWEYSVAPEHVEEFRTHYGPEGSWVRLFRGADGFRGTRLLRDHTDSSRFVTIDTWTSEAAHSAFLEQHRDAFDRLDMTCEALTDAETLLGYFELDGHTGLGD